jgi:hypothetical protein
MFLFAREQVASNTCSDRYSGARAMHRWAPYRARGARRATDAPESHAG